MMELYRHQDESRNLCDKVVAALSPVRKLILEITPGAGKSLHPVIWGSQLIGAGLADAICWVTPRQSLQEQAERVFINKEFRNLLGHNLNIRQSTNEYDPCRGLAGYTTTYTAIGTDGKPVTGLQLNLKEFRTKRYILVLDEPHHLWDDGMWRKAVDPLVAEAKYLILMSGTFARHDTEKIANLPYRQLPNGLWTPDWENLPSDTFAIRYGLRDALEEHVIIPIHFYEIDGKTEWIETDGQVGVAGGFGGLSDELTRKALYTALNTDYARDLLDACYGHWRDHKRKFNNRSKLLVVAPSIRQAELYLKILESWGGHGSARIATSKDSKDALEAIRQFKKTDSSQSLDILVTVGMAYEGMDVPPATHLAALTNIRSAPYLAQMINRVTRVDRKAGSYCGQYAFVFHPNDECFRDCIQYIKDEQDALAKEGKIHYPPDRDDEDTTDIWTRRVHKTKTEDTDDDDQKPDPRRIIPLDGTMTGTSAGTIDTDERIETEMMELLDMYMEECGLKGASVINVMRFVEKFDIDLAAKYGKKETASSESEESEATPTMIERAFRREIQRHANCYDAKHGLDKGATNSAIEALYGPRDRMGRELLLKVWTWLRNERPIKE